MALAWPIIQHAKADFLQTPFYGVDYSYYQGYDSGVFFDNEGVYSKTGFGDPPSRVYTPEECPDVQDPFVGYDCRCRPWYQFQIEPEN